HVGHQSRRSRIVHRDELFWHRVMKNHRQVLFVINQADKWNPAMNGMPLPVHLPCCNGKSLC
ncbi:hypothetical protein J4731_24600, partial [Providencia rettgeri]|nr:hypothetical protein [Providencia rettgeri]